MHTNNLHTLPPSDAESVSGGLSIPTPERLALKSGKEIQPIHSVPVEPKEPIYITQALHEDGGHWRLF